MNGKEIFVTLSASEGKNEIIFLVMVDTGSS